MQAEAGRRMREKPLPKGRHNRRVRVAGRGRGQLLWSIHLAAGFVGDGCLWVYFLSFSFYMVTPSSVRKGVSLPAQGSHWS